MNTCMRDLHVPGVYSVQKPPDEWPNLERLLDNNYRRMLKRDIDLKGREAAVKESSWLFLDVLLLRHDSVTRRCLFKPCDRGIQIPGVLLHPHPRQRIHGL